MAVKAKKKAKGPKRGARPRVLIVVAGNTVMGGFAVRISRSLAAKLRTYDPKSDKGVIEATRAFIAPQTSDIVSIVAGPYSRPPR